MFPSMFRNMPVDRLGANRLRRSQRGRTDCVVRSNIRWNMPVDRLFVRNNMPVDWWFGKQFAVVQEIITFGIELYREFPSWDSISGSRCSCEQFRWLVDWILNHLIPDRHESPPWFCRSRRSRKRMVFPLSPRPSGNHWNVVLAASHPHVWLIQTLQLFGANEFVSFIQMPSRNSTLITRAALTRGSSKRPWSRWGRWIFVQM